MTMRDSWVSVDEVVAESLHDVLETSRARPSTRTLRADLPKIVGAGVLLGLVIAVMMRLFVAAGEGASAPAVATDADRPHWPSLVYEPPAIIDMTADTADSATTATTPQETAPGPQSQ